MRKTEYQRPHSANKYIFKSKKCESFWQNAFDSLENLVFQCWMSKN